jgi:hypothetical protein
MAPVSRKNVKSQQKKKKKMHAEYFHEPPA